MERIQTYFGKLMSKNDEPAARVAIWALIVLLVGLLAWISIILISRAGKTEVELLVAPTGADVLMDGKEVKPGNLHLEPGQYNFEVTKQGFKSENVTREVTEEADQIIIVALLPESDEAWRSIRSDPAYAEIEIITGDQAREEGRVFAEANPITRELPYRGPIYDIDYKLKDPNDDNSGIVLQISLIDPAAKESALSQIRYWGYEPSDFTIEYTSP